MLNKRSRKTITKVAIGGFVLLAALSILTGIGLFVLKPAVENVFRSVTGREYCVEFFLDDNGNGQQDVGEETLQVGGAKFNELHEQQIYATYSANVCAPMEYVDFDVQVILPAGYHATTPLIQNQNGHYDDKRYVFRFGVQRTPQE
jgi:hypothetical protein